VSTQPQEQLLRFHYYPKHIPVKYNQTWKKKKEKKKKGHNGTTSPIDFYRREINMLDAFSCRCI